MVQRITPGRVRHLMVTFAENNPAIFAGREDLVAAAMGHHTRMWHEVYDQVRCCVGVGGRGCVRLLGELPLWPVPSSTA